MAKFATLKLDEKEITLPVLTGSEGEKAIDISKLRADTGHITFDDGFGNTGSCTSKITFIDGEAGILRYRGYPIEQLAEKSNFVETAYLVRHGELPTSEQRSKLSALLTAHAPLSEGMVRFIQSFPHSAHPMAVLSASLNALGAYYPHLASNNHQNDLAHFDEAAAIAISKVRTIAAHSFRVNAGKPLNYPRPNIGYCENFLHLMFSDPYNEFVPTAEVASALNLFLLLHADHEQNCSTTAMRTIGSSQADPYSATAGAAAALYGPLHGGANEAVIHMLKRIGSVDQVPAFVEAVKRGEGRLMGFGHRVYKSYDPRARIVKATADRVFEITGSNPLLDIALELESVALDDDYFIGRKLYPNVDFYSGLIYQAMGFPMEMFTVLFAIPRTAGWLAHWLELLADNEQRIARPRQKYIGPDEREYVELPKRETGAS